MQIVLHTFRPAFGLASVSPFCLKLETYLRMVGLDYERAPYHPSTAPKGKAPYINLDGAWHADSSEIIALLETKVSEPLDAGISATDAATATLLQRTLEEHVYFVETYTRWVRDEGWADYKHVIGAELPAIVRPLMMPFLRRGVKRDQRGQGMGRHDLAEVCRRGIRDLDAVVTLLGNHAFLFGDAPRTIDATLYAFLAHAVHCPYDDAYHEHARTNDAVVAYVRRVQDRYFAD